MIIQQNPAQKTNSFLRDVAVGAVGGTFASLAYGLIYYYVTKSNILQ